LIPILEGAAMMSTAAFANSLATVFAELIDGAPKSGGYTLNGGDEGLLRSLDKLSAAEVSALTATGSSIAAHVDHLRYGLSLMNRWNQGENPFEDADFMTSWRKPVVSEPEWRQLRTDLRIESSAWLEALRMPRQIDESDLNGVIGSIAHLAYHLGAIRQINRAARGPSESATT
jgi:hypothetical protein